MGAGASWLTEVVLRAYENYWAGKPTIDRVIYKVVPEEANRVLLLKSGDVDMSYFISAEQVKNQLMGAPGVTVYSIPTAGTENGSGTCTATERSRRE